MLLFFVIFTERSKLIIEEGEELMSCSYKDGEYCSFCCSYLNGNIRDMERACGYTCTDDYYCCPIASYVAESYEEYEKWHDAWKDGKVDRHGNINEDNDDRDFYGHEENDNCITGGGPAAENSFLFRVGMCLLFAASIVFASAASSYCIGPLFTNNSGLTEFIRFISYAGVPTMFAACFRHKRSMAVLILICFLLIGGLSFLGRSFNIKWMITLGYVLGSVGFLLSVIAGAVPGSFAYISTTFLPTFLNFKYSDVIVFVFSIALFSIIFGIIFMNQLDKRLKVKK